MLAESKRAKRESNGIRQILSPTTSWAQQYLINMIWGYQHGLERLNWGKNEVDI